MPPVARFWIVLIFGWLALGPHDEARARSFRHPEDTLAYANELLWEYHVDPATGKFVAQRRDPKPEYTLHCYAVARTVRQFFLHARFAPEEPPASAASYRHLVRLVLTRNGRVESKPARKIVIPGYPDLRAFSADHAALLKKEGGGAWRSYLQRGNWRVVFPFSRGGQRRTAERLADEIANGRLPIVHIVQFPSMHLNHVLLLFDVRNHGDDRVFTVYDPNRPAERRELTFQPGTGEFQLPANEYFPGGRVDVYEIYRNWCF